MLFQEEVQHILLKHPRIIPSKGHFNYCSRVYRPQNKGDAPGSGNTEALTRPVNKPPAAQTSQASPGALPNLPCPQLYAGCAPLAPTQPQVYCQVISLIGRFLQETWNYT